ncbi:site-2 protease family protein [Isoptericola sp. b441]|uniref:Site-2 protease family protein n=1 Tax=Actinotalea lenta TaxID=3064654 RepID=A0ABT9D9V0_9CELL|nr:MULTISPECIES: site-2 protease family protein [unclassified Isoptericola]MDO8107350.1 site-2 protease family protein [Isoptericola sp. b441]MDO8120987.1 site-2 protease family protein [Isoptericola sp. b490]
MAYVVGLVVLLVGLLVSIALHEVGHMVPAKRFGVRVSQYMVGFGPTVWSRVRGETEYGVKGIPLGGYVRLIGMYPPKEALGRPPRAGRFAELVDGARQASAEEIRPGEDTRAFYRLSAPKKIVVMLGGPMMNLVIAAVLLTVIMAGIGLPGSQATTTVGSVGQCVTTQPTDSCTAADPRSPAVQAGLRPGDRIVSWGPRQISSWSDVQTAIKDVPGENIPVVVERDGRTVTLHVSPVVANRPVFGPDGTPKTDANGTLVVEPTRYVGFSPTAAIERQPLTAVPAALGNALGQTVAIVATLPGRLVDVTKAALGMQARSPSSVVGVVGVARLAGEIGEAPIGLSQRIAGWLSILASLNIALFVFNLIPLVPLDGGHVAGAIWEGARRAFARWRGLPRPAPSDVARMVPVAYGVFLVLVAMSLVLVVADLVAPVRI